MTPEPPVPEVTLPLEAVREVVNERDMLRAEVARLRDILDAERGVRGREGWEWKNGGWKRDNIRTSFLFPGCWHECMTGHSFPTALEAMEAADAARGAR